jgi:hypothetical protein
VFIRRAAEARRLRHSRIGKFTRFVLRQWRAAALKAGTSTTMLAKSYRLLRPILNTAVTEDELI